MQSQKVKLNMFVVLSKVEIPILSDIQMPSEIGSLLSQTLNNSYRSRPLPEPLKLTMLEKSIFTMGLHNHVLSILTLAN